jgi:two-component system, NtrC family, nitrogen regulation response regulator NtrX
MTLQTQAKVLRVLETQVFQRVGSGKSIKVDVRILAATNKDLSEEVKKGGFREDLFFRLNVIPLIVPPLRERKDDIPQLVKYFIELFSSECGIKPKTLDVDALRLFTSYNWPGNIRELRNATERLMIMVPASVITAADIAALGMFKPGLAVKDDDYFSFATLKDARDAFEKDYICRKLKENDWNVSKTADAISVERSNLHKKIKSYGISEGGIN